jgi:hypothetical protein
LAAAALPAGADLARSHCTQSGISPTSEHITEIAT